MNIETNLSCYVLVIDGVQSRDYLLRLVLELVESDTPSAVTMAVVHGLGKARESHLLLNRRSDSYRDDTMSLQKDLNKTRKSRKKGTRK